MAVFHQLAKREIKQKQPGTFAVNLCMEKLVSSPIDNRASFMVRILLSTSFSSQALKIQNIAL